MSSPGLDSDDYGKGNGSKRHIICECRSKDPDPKDIDILWCDDSTIWLSKGHWAMSVDYEYVDSVWQEKAESGGTGSLLVSICPPGYCKGETTNSKVMFVSCFLAVLIEWVVD